MFWTCGSPNLSVRLSEQRCPKVLRESRRHWGRLPSETGHGTSAGGSPTWNPALGLRQQRPDNRHDPLLKPRAGVEVILSQPHNLNPVVTMTPKVDTNSGKFCLLRSSMLLNEHLPEILPVKHASPNYEGCRGAARLSLQHMRPSGYQPQLPAVHTSSNCLLWFVFLSPRLAFMVPPINLP